MIRCNDGCFRALRRCWLMAAEAIILFRVTRLLVSHLRSSSTNPPSNPRSLKRGQGDGNGRVRGALPTLCERGRAALCRMWPVKRKRPERAPIKLIRGLVNLASESYSELQKRFHLWLRNRGSWGLGFGVERFYLTQSVLQVALQKSIPTPTRQPILCISNTK